MSHVHGCAANVVHQFAWDCFLSVSQIAAEEGCYGAGRHVADEQVVSMSTTRLHNIAGKYTGNDDPTAIVRPQGIFPAPEEIIEPYLITPFVTGDARGSHVMPLLPMPINSALNGPYCHPIVSAVAFSMDASGRFTHNFVDLFDGPAWEEARRRSQQKALDMRSQGFFGAAMAGVTEIAYTGLVDTQRTLNAEFRIRSDSVSAEPAEAQS
jgi:fructose 1,6-bisphosphate aldolase/phosphatase